MTFRTVPGIKEQLSSVKLSNYIPVLTASIEDIVPLRSELCFPQIHMLSAKPKDLGMCLYFS